MIAQSHNSPLCSGSRLLVDALLVNQVQRAFCVPGESFLAVIDNLADMPEQLQLVVCRHEANAANMATAHGKLTGQPGICFVTRGPGASHGTIGVHTAAQDGVPMIMFVGQVERRARLRGAFQEIDYVQMYGKLAKWVAEIDDASRIPELVSRAFHVAVNGRPGPVVLALPEDMLLDKVPAVSLMPYRLAESAPSAQALGLLKDMLGRACKPLLVLGGSGWTQAVRDDVQIFAERHGVPVANGFRCQDSFDNRHPNYVGELGLGTSPALTRYVADSDLIITLGERLGEATTRGYTLLPIPRPSQSFVQIQPEPQELACVYQSDLLIAATLSACAQALRTLPASPVGALRRQRLIAGREAYEAYAQPPILVDAKLNLAAIVRGLSDCLPKDAIVTNGAGNYAGYVSRYHQFSSAQTQLAPVSGSMAFGLAAAIAAQMAYPARTVVCYAGDGCLLMSSPDLMTVVQYRLPILIVLINNASYGSIRLHQERRYPGRVYATDLENPDFVALAKAYGLQAASVESTQDFEVESARLLKTRLPSLIEIRTDTAAMIAHNPRR